MQGRQHEGCVVHCGQDNGPSLEVSAKEKEEEAEETEEKENYKV
jgi:hypothetical protein